jgi:hypothetical protein
MWLVSQHVLYLSERAELLEIVVILRSGMLTLVCRQLQSTVIIVKGIILSMACCRTQA